MGIGRSVRSLMRQDLGGKAMPECTACLLVCLGLQELVEVELRLKETVVVSTMARTAESWTGFGKGD